MGVGDAEVGAVRFELNGADLLVVGLDTLIVLDGFKRGVEDGVGGVSASLEIAGEAD